MRRLVVFLTVGALLLGLMSAAAVASVVHRAKVHSSFDGDGLVTILAIGSDIGPPYRPGDPRRGRADALQIISVDPKVKRATIVSLPRDSFMGGDKVNAHLARGGPERLVSVIESATGVPIDHWVLMSFRSFEDAVDGMGGLEIQVKRPMVDRYSKANFKSAGVHHVDGKEALAFTRTRYALPDGDFGRTRHQGDFLRALHRHLRRTDPGLVELAEMAALLQQTSETSIPPRELIPLGMLALDIHPNQVLHVPLKGSLGKTRGGASIVRLNPGDTFRRIRNGRVGP
jgi:polyisoprenyl-teichoic acid--peptidoglycan teichoic acid transferase